MSFEAAPDNVKLRRIAANLTSIACMMENGVYVDAPEDLCRALGWNSEKINDIWIEQSRDVEVLKETSGGGR